MVHGQDGMILPTQDLITLPTVHGWDGMILPTQDMITLPMVHVQDGMILPTSHHLDMITLPMVHGWNHGRDLDLISTYLKVSSAGLKQLKLITTHYCCNIL